MKKRAVTLLTLLAVSASLMACGGSDATAVSYTHLDVYKRQGGAGCLIFKAGGGL